MKSIYVAGASGEIDIVEPYVKRLKEAGFLIAHDWCAAVRKVGSANAWMTRAERRHHARVDREVAQLADVFWLLVPKQVSVGCWVEFGYATHQASTTKRVVVSADDERSIFTALADEHFETHENAFRYLVVTRDL